jgi:hypothetical protein
MEYRARVKISLSGRFSPFCCVPTLKRRAPCGGTEISSTLWITVSLRGRRLRIQWGPWRRPLPPLLTICRSSWHDKELCNGARATKEKGSLELGLGARGNSTLAHQEERRTRRGAPPRFHLLGPLPAVPCDDIRLAGLAELAEVGARDVVSQNCFAFVYS